MTDSPFTDLITEIMKEGDIRKSFIGHVSRFFGGDRRRAAAAIEEKLEGNTDYDTGRLYFDLTSGLGSGKSHDSGKRVGKKKHT